jgi:PilZ domain
MKSPMTPYRQKRRWTRRSVDFPVKVAIYSGTKRTLIPGRVAELSEGGMMLYAGLPLDPGDLLEVEFQIPFSRTIQAVVRDRNGCAFGLEFVAPLTP